MTFSEVLLAEFDSEMAVTRRVLERAPEAAFEWRPHEKSYSLGALSAHLAQLPHWGAQILEQESYDLANAGGKPPVTMNQQQVLETFDRHVAEVRRALTSRTDAELRAPWSLKRGTQTVLTMPRAAALQRFLLNHVVHHRGQLTVYLRLQNVALPPIYGPTADERM